MRTAWAGHRDLTHKIRALGAVSGESRGTPSILRDVPGYVTLHSRVTAGDQDRGVGAMGLGSRS